MIGCCLRWRSDSETISRLCCHFNGSTVVGVAIFGDDGIDHKFRGDAAFHAFRAVRQNKSGHFVLCTGTGVLLNGLQAGGECQDPIYRLKFPPAIFAIFIFRNFWKHKSTYLRSAQPIKKKKHFWHTHLYSGSIAFSKKRPTPPFRA